jgi:hypothetical protein
VAVCAQAGAALEANGADLVECDVAALLDPDIGAIDGLARLALTARRHDGSIRLLGAGMRLRSLLALAGLADVMPCVSAGSDVEPRR